MSNAMYVRRSGAWVPLARKLDSLALPTGYGIYNYSTLISTVPSVTDVQSALNWVAGRHITDGVLTGGSNLLTSSMANFSSADVGRLISNSSKLSAGTTITQYLSATQVNLSNNATGSASGNALDIGLEGNALTFPTGTYNIIPSFTQDNNDLCVFIPKNVSIYGQGPARTKFVLTGTLTMASPLPSIPFTTNSNYVMQTVAGSNGLTLANFSLDMSGVADSTAAYKGVYSSGATYASQDIVRYGTYGALFRALGSSSSGHTPIGGQNDSYWEYIAFSGIQMYNAANPTVTNVLIKGHYGWSNGPPGETHGLTFYSCTGAINISDVEVDGNGTGGTGISLESKNNAGTSYVLNRTFTHDAGWSHGIATFQSGNMTFNDCIATDNGKTAPGTGYSGANGFNHEESFGYVVHNRSIANHGNSQASMRIEAGDGGGVDNPNITLNAVTLTNSNYAIKLRGMRIVSDGVLAGTTTVTSASAQFTSADVGRIITAPGIPASTFISVINSTTSAVLTNAATVSASGVTLKIGGQQTIPTIDSSSILRGTKPSSTSGNSFTNTYPIPSIFVGP